MAHNSSDLSPNITNSDLVEQLKKTALLLLIVFSLLVNVLAPILASQWARLPFLGVLAEHTLVIANVNNPAWPAQQKIADGVHILRGVNDVPVANSRDLVRAVEPLTFGDTVTLTLRQIDSPGLKTITTEVIMFPWTDFLVVFALPYLIGLIYLALGLFVYRVRASKRAGRLFASFCALFSIFTGTFFNIYTYHQFTPIWTAVLPFLGASLVHLALVFPLKARLIRKRPRSRFIPYILASVLSLNGLISLYSNNPTGYFLAWRLEFAFIGLSILAFLGILLWSWYLHFSPLVKQQVFIVLLGSLAAFFPALAWSLYTAWLGAASVLSMPLYITIFGPTILFPISLAYAILRYQLLAVENIVRKLAVYFSLIVTIILVYFGIIATLNGLLSLSISISNPVTLSIYGLIVLVFLEPARIWFQQYVDRISSDTTKDHQEILQTFTGRLANLPLNVDDILDLYLDQVQAGIHTSGVFVFLIDAKETSYTIRTRFGKEAKASVEISYTVSDELPQWLNTKREVLRLNAEGAPVTESVIDREEIARLAMLDIRIVVPVIGTEKLLGWLALSDKHGVKPYDKNDLAFLTNISNQTAIALENAQRFETANRKTRELIALQETTLDIASEQETDRILTSVLERATNLLDAMGGSIYLLDPVYSLLNNEICFNLDPDYASISLKIGQGIAGRVAKTGQPLSANKYKGFQDQVEVYSGDDFGSVSAVPLAWKDEVKGVLELIRARHALPFDENDLELLRVLANQAAIALENARLIREANAQAEQLATLNDVNRIISATLDRDAALKLIMEKAANILGTEAGSIFVVDEKNKTLIFEIAIGPTGVQLVGAEIPLDTTSIAGSIAVSQKAMIVNDVATDPHWNTTFDEASEFKTRDILGVPMIAFNRVVGVIEVINKRDSRGFNADDLSALATFAGQSAIALLNAERFTRTDAALANRVQELNTLQMIDRELNATLDFDTVLNLMLTRTMDALAASVGLVGVVDEGGTGLYFRSMIGIARKYQLYKQSPWPIDRGNIGRVASTGMPILAAKGDLDAFASDGRSISQLCIPIELEGRIMGVMSLELAEAFTEKDQEFAVRLASHAALAIQNARLFEEVNSANQAKTEFMSVASHELKIPMTSIKGYAKLLEMIGGENFSEQQKDFLEIIIANIDRMNRLVSDLLDVSRIEAGRVRLEMSEVSISDVVEEVVQSVSTQIQSKDLALEIDIAETIPIIQADHGRLVQVMTNLISNAYKYTPDGGQIAVKVQQALGQDNGKYLSVCVSDTGFGISEEDQKELFNKFFRASDPNIRDEPGTGLGLAITKSLIEIHGGQMWFESNLGQGSTFGFDLPLGA